MRKALLFIFVVGLLALAQPAEAQLRANVPSVRAQSRLFNDSGAGVMLNKLFSPEHFRMSHAYEMSFGSFGGDTHSMGMYTNTLAWQFSDKLAAKVDVSLAHNLLGGGMDNKALGLGRQNGKVFLRNAEVAYRPTERTLLHLSIRQSPYGSYMGPYGYMNPGAYGGPFGYASRSEDLFWRARSR